MPCRRHGLNGGKGSGEPRGEERGDKRTERIGQGSEMQGEVEGMRGHGERGTHQGLSLYLRALISLLASVYVSPAI